MSSHQPRVLIVGGGIIGLTTAWILSGQGALVTVFDPQPAKGATFAAAGMLAPLAEITPGEEENFALQRSSVASWRSIAVELESVTASSFALHSVGTMMTAWDGGDRLLLEQFRQVLTSFGQTGTVVHRSEQPDLFAGLSDRLQSAFLLADDGWLNPDEVVRALSKGLEARGVALVTTSVDEVASTASSVVVRSGDVELHGDVGIIATGASSLPTGFVPSEGVRVRPVRGMTVRVRGADRFGLPMVRTYVRGRPFYAVGRADGYSVLGASSEEKGGSAVEVGEMQRLLRDALDVMPTLETAAILETRSGLRPASLDGLPFFDAPQGSRWAWSSGHYRHGVTLAPDAARRAAAFVAEVTA